MPSWTSVLDLGSLWAGGVIAFHGANSFTALTIDRITFDGYCVGVEIASNNAPKTGDTAPAMAKRFELDLGMDPTQVDDHLQMVARTQEGTCAILYPANHPRIPELIAN